MVSSLYPSLFGKQPASSKFCCPFCVDCSPLLGSCPLSTIGSLWRDYTGYIEAGSVKAKAMKFHNVVNPPLVTGPEDQLILGETILFPEHHIFSGIVGKLVKELERNVFGDPGEGASFMNEWMANPGVNVCRTVWHGSASFVGNMAELVLARVDHLVATLREYLANRPEHLTQADNYVRALRQLDSVVHSCFGQDLQPNTVLRGSVRASAVTVWINCLLSPVTCGQLNLTLLPIDVGSLLFGKAKPMQFNTTGD